MAKADDLDYIQTLSIQCSLDHIFHEELTYRLCVVMDLDGVIPIRHCIIIWDYKILGIWVILPHDMNLLMHHVVGVVNLPNMLGDFHFDCPPHPCLAPALPP